MSIANPTNRIHEIRELLRQLEVEEMTQENMIVPSADLRGSWNKVKRLSMKKIG